MSTVQYNSKSAGVKRLMREAMELAEPTEMFFAQPMEDNLFEWHFTVRGPLDTKFDGGIYHGKIIFPSEYPMKPPNLIVLTPNGRFELNKKICLSISGYHPETWLPSWSVRTALLALIGFMPSEPGGALGSLDYPEAEIRKLAKASVNWTCKECGICMKDALKPLVDGSVMNKEAQELASKLIFKDETEASRSLPTSSNTEPTVLEENAEESTPPLNTLDAESLANQVPSPPKVLSRPTTNNNNNMRESSCDIHLFIFIPLCLLSFAVFGMLVARRAYM